MKFKTYFLLLLFALLFFICSGCISNDTKFTLNIGDTYYVMSGADFYKCFAIVTFTTGLIYGVLDKSGVKLNQLWSKIHIFATLLSILIFLNYKSNTASISIIWGSYSDSMDYTLYRLISLTLIIFLQFFFLINIFVVQIKNLKITAAK